MAARTPRSAAELQVVEATDERLARRLGILGTDEALCKSSVDVDENQIDVPSAVRLPVDGFERGRLRSIPERQAAFARHTRSELSEKIAAKTGGGVAHFPAPHAMCRLRGYRQACGPTAIGAVEIDSGAEVAMIVAANKDHAIELARNVAPWTLGSSKAHRGETDGQEAAKDPEEVTSMHRLDPRRSESDVNQRHDFGLKRG